MSKRALILGIGGQDGSYLAEHLLEAGYDVHGLYRRSSGDNLVRLDPVRDRVALHRGDLAEPQSVERVVRRVSPDEVYNLADQDHVGWSVDTPAYSSEVTAGAVGRLMETVLAVDPKIRVFQPISATVFGNHKGPQSETAPLDPMSPYACAKAHAWHLCRYYRRVRGLHVVCGVLYNHDSPRRGDDYMLQSVCRQAIEVATGLRERVLVGDPDGEVDLGYAGEYVTYFPKALAVEAPDDYVMGTGSTDRVGNLASESLRQVGRDPSLVSVDPSWRPGGDRGRLVADCRKAREAFGWSPKVGTRQLIRKILRDKYGFHFDTGSD